MSEQRRLNHRQYLHNLYYSRISNNLCVDCGSRQPKPGYRKCLICTHRRNKLQREQRGIKSAKQIDNLIDKGLITTTEAANILKVSKEAILQRIWNGEIKVHSERGISKGRAFWVKESDILSIKRSQLPNMQCSKCKHSWHSDKVVKCCPRPDCHSIKVSELTPSEGLQAYQYKRKITFKPLTALQKESMMRDRLNGMTLISICDKYKISPKTFYKYWGARHNAT